MRIAFLPLTLVALTGAATLHAGEPERVTARVSLDGIDLASGRHQAEIERRVMVAARRACSERSAGSLRVTAGARACIAEMLADARAQTTRRVGRTHSAGMAGAR